MWVMGKVHSIVSVNGKAVLVWPIAQGFLVPWAEQSISSAEQLFCLHTGFYKSNFRFWSCKPHLYQKQGQLSQIN